LKFKYNFVILGAVALAVVFLVVSPARTVVKTDGGRDAASHIANLGSINLVARVPQEFDLGSEKTCTLTGRRTGGSIEVTIEFHEPNPDGKKPPPEKDVITTLPGRQTGILENDTLVEFTATLVQR
jgi:hypothetical protein